MATGTRSPGKPGFPRFGTISNAAALGVDAPPPRRGLALRALVRAVDGMQKEALVVSSATGVTWRLASDEGPYLAGTDLAPPPLGLFCAGMVAASANEILKLAAEHGVELQGVRLAQDTFYTMEGSALRGTMTGGALPPELTLEAESGLRDGELRELATAAVAASPLSGLLRGAHDSRFALVHNGTRIETGRVRPLPGEVAADPLDAFERADATTLDDHVLQRVRAAEQVQGEGGVESSLRAEQSRTLRARAACRIRADGVKVIDQFLFRPIGSQFRLLSAEDGRAPDAFSYLAAGLGFCFMTQLGRYATITRRPLDGYRIVQDTHFSTNGGAADPVETHVFLDTLEDADSARQILDMGEQTCFLHALCRTDVDPQVRTAPASRTVDR